MDGFAEELVIHRGPCLPQRRTPPAVDEARASFCARHPQGTTAIYKRNDHGVLYEATAKQPLVSHTTETRCPPHGYYGMNGCHALSTDAADLDGDALPDLSVLFLDRLELSYSMHRPPGLQFTLNASETIILPKACRGRALRVVDLDRRGVNDLLVACNDPRLILRYQGKPGAWAAIPLDVPCNVEVTPAERAKVCQKRGERNRTVAAHVWRLPPIEQSVCDGVASGLAGFSVADVDNDGFLDLITTAKRGRFRILKRTQRPRNAFIHVKLEACAPGNRGGIGATILLHVRNAPVPILLHEFGSAEGRTEHLGFRDPRVVFGLGPTGTPDRVVVRWPGRMEQIVVLDDVSRQKHVSDMENPLVVVQPC